MNNLRIAGITLITTSLGFIAVFGYLASSFGYPEVLDGHAHDVLPAFLAGGQTMRAVWAIYAALPSGIALSAILIFPMLRDLGETRARLGLVAAIAASVAMTAGLMRWPTLNYTLARSFIDASPDQRRVLATLFDAGNLYLGTITGEFIGELCLSLWFVTLGLALVTPRLDHLHLGTRAWRWVGGLGLLTGISMSIGAFRNVVSAVGPISALNNNLLPIWLIALGAMLLGTCRSDGHEREN